MNENAKVGNRLYGPGEIVPWWGGITCDVCGGVFKDQNDWESRHNAEAADEVYHESCCPMCVMEV